MKTIQGLVKNSKGEGIYGAKVYIADNTGKKLYANKYGAVTQFDGTFKIVLPSELIRSERWINVLNPTNAKRSSLKIKDNQSNYVFENSDKGGGTQEIDEVVISAKRKKKNKYKPYIIGGSILLALILGYVVYKEVKKNK